MIAVRQRNGGSPSLAILEYARKHDFRIDDFIEATASGQLLVHQAEGVRERGVAVSLSYNPTTVYRTGRGVFVREHLLGYGNPPQLFLSDRDGLRRRASDRSRG